MLNGLSDNILSAPSNFTTEGTLGSKPVKSSPPSREGTIAHYSPGARERWRFAREAISRGYFPLFFLYVWLGDRISLKMLVICQTWSKLVQIYLHLSNRVLNYSPGDREKWRFAREATSRSYFPLLFCFLSVLEHRSCHVQIVWILKLLMNFESLFSFNFQLKKTATEFCILRPFQAIKVP